MDDAAAAAPAPGPEPSATLEKVTATPIIKPVVVSTGRVKVKVNCEFVCWLLVVCFLACCHVAPREQRLPPHSTLLCSMQLSDSWPLGNGTSLTRTYAAFATASLSAAARAARYLVTTARPCGAPATMLFTCTASCVGWRPRAVEMQSVPCAGGRGSSEPSNYCRCLYTFVAL